MQSQNNSIQKAQGNGLSKILREQEGNSAIVRFLRSFSVEKAVQAHTYKRYLEDSLASLRRKYIEYRNNKYPNRVYVMQELKREAQAVKAEMQKLPGYRTIRELSEQSEDNTILDISELLLWTCDQFNINKNMSSEQIRNCAELIMTDHSDMYIEEVGLCLRNGVAGKYGEVFDRLDSNTILKWLKQYKKDKTERIRELNEQKHASSKADPTEERNQRKAEPAKMDPTEYFQEQKANSDASGSG